MFCEAIAVATLSKRSGRTLEPRHDPAVPLVGPSLYSSLRHCSDCRRTLRVYASVQQIVTGTVDGACPDCGRDMEPSGEPGSSPRAVAPRRTFAAVAPSAFAA